MRSYNDFITVAERAAAFDTGVGMGANLCGYTKAAGTKLVKEAFLGNVLKIPIALAMLAGVPAGIAIHTIDQQIANMDAADREQLLRKKYYRDAATDLEGALAGAKLEA